MTDGGTFADPDGRNSLASDQLRPRMPVAAPPPVALWGALLVGLALGLYLMGVGLAALQRVGGFDQGTSRALLWASGAPLILGLVSVLLDVLLLAPQRRGDRVVMNAPLESPRITVALTAYNDELSIGDAVADFLGHPLVARVVVVDNDSSDRTAEIARSRGAVVHVENRRGYGQCVNRCLVEASRYEDTVLVALCEGDMTFRAADLDKLVAYAPHAHVVNGTRIAEQLRSPETQLTSFMFYGNFVVAKLLEFKHLGRGTISDVGTTYKLCRTDFLRGWLPSLDPEVNLEFNAHFLDRLLSSRYHLVEAPVTFHARVGQSKGGNTSNRRAAAVGIRMLLGMTLGWKIVA